MAKQPPPLTPRERRQLVEAPLPAITTYGGKTHGGEITTDGLLRRNRRPSATPDSEYDAYTRRDVD